MTDAPIRILDTATKFEPSHRDAVVVCGSHGGVYPAYLAATAGLRAVILNDAAVGLTSAGIGCLDYCVALGMAAATVAHHSARIGNAADMRARGRISHVNPIAADLGCAPGQSVEDAARRLAQAEAWHGVPPAYREGRKIVVERPGLPRVICMDSVSLVMPGDAGQIVVTGSHGGLLGGTRDAALAVDALAALYNDAGIGADEAGVGRLPALDARGIAAATVDAMTARIGDGLSTYRDGIVSRLNDTARARGGRVGISAVELVELFLTG